MWQIPNDFLPLNSLASPGFNYLSIPRLKGRVAERGAEIVELLLADALGVAGQDLHLNLINGASDCRQEELPAHADVLPLP
ncbi:hypothetical protein SRHO_G00154790 [Serrasalmus rhombeus]